MHGFKSFIIRELINLRRGMFFPPDMVSYSIGTAGVTAGEEDTMKSFVLTLAMGLILTSSAAIAADTIEKPLSCEQCGMDRVIFSRSRMVIVYADGTTAGTCSIHCAVAEMRAHKGKKVKALEVADYDTKKLINAETAVWVVGGNKEGVMTAVPKWAFATKAGADKFVAENRGKVATFQEALELADHESTM
jgi:copper chaperone NosL